MGGIYGITAAPHTVRIGLTRAFNSGHCATLKGLIWPLSDDLDDAAVERLLFPPAAHIDTDKRVMPSMEYLHQELKKKRVTLQLLWSEYKRANPDGYQYSQFCERYRQWTGKLDVCLRQTYRAGEKLFVDYAGQTIPVTDSLSGKTREAYLFVATLGASNYTFAWASFSQDLPSWISAHTAPFTSASISIDRNLNTSNDLPSRPTRACL